MTLPNEVVDLAFYYSNVIGPLLNRKKYPLASVELRNSVHGFREILNNYSSIEDTKVIIGLTYRMSTLQIACSKDKPREDNIIKIREGLDSRLEQLKETGLLPKD